MIGRPARVQGRADSAGVPGHGAGMTDPPRPGPASSPVQVAVARDGTRGYLVAVPPADLPPVRARDLEAAWDAARDAAARADWGVPRLFRFRGADGAPSTELALADPDACCWATAVDRTLGLASAYGISVCLRLLALVDLLASAAWAGPWFSLRRDGAAIEPQLWRAAAALPLNEEGRLDEPRLRARLAAASLAPASLLRSGAAP